MANTITVRRGNVVLDVAPERKQYYMNAGYSVIDSAGNVVEAAMPSDVHTLQAMVANLQAENKKLKADLKKAKEKASKE